MEVAKIYANAASSWPYSVLVVIVLYKKSFKETPSAALLRGWLSQPIDGSTNFNVARCLIYDNSPVKQYLDLFDCTDLIDVVHDPSNGGTRAAYLCALEIAKAKECSWILFLDHDTELPRDFLLAVETALSIAPRGTKICAIVPSVFDNSVQISPASITAYGRGFSKGGAWRLRRKNTTLTAIASASMIRTESFMMLPLIPKAFSLDYLDHWLFRELQLRGETIFVSSARVEHSLSVQAIRTISTYRYRSILAAELNYLRSGPRYSLASHFIWHFVRTIKVALVTGRPALLRVCLNGLYNIVVNK